MTANANAARLCIREALRQLNDAQGKLINDGRWSLRNRLQFIMYEQEDCLYKIGQDIT